MIDLLTPHYPLQLWIGEFFSGSLSVGSVSQSVTVTDSTLHIETENTQIGQVITGREITAAPLDGRSYTDLLSLQPGVAPEMAITSSTVQDVGATILDPSGTLNPGNLSVNGQKETANYFGVNGSDVEEDVNAGAAVILNLDSIAEFRIITSNFDVVTKSGGNAIHGDAFEFLRNTDLDARNFFSPARGAFRRNQFGGTFGGPIRKNKLFFFLDYQGTRQTQGVDTGNIAVPSAADRTGNLSDFTTGSRGNQLSGVVSGPYFANILSQRLGYQVTSGEPYYLPGCASSTSCVFPKALIPQRAWSIPAQRLLEYIPAPNTAAGAFATSSYNQTVRDKAGSRVDWNTRGGGCLQPPSLMRQTEPATANRFRTPLLASTHRAAIPILTSTGLLSSPSAVYQDTTYIITPPIPRSGRCRLNAGPVRRPSLERATSALLRIGSRC